MAHWCQKTFSGASQGGGILWLAVPLIAWQLTFVAWDPGLGQVEHCAILRLDVTV